MEDVKDKVKYHYDELEEYSGNWKNISFDYSGKSYIGVLTHDTEKAALIRIQKVMVSGISKYLKGHGYRILKTKISYTIQMPIGDK